MNELIIMSTLMIILGIICSAFILFSGITLGSMLEKQRFQEEILPSMAQAIIDGELDVEQMKVTIGKEGKEEINDD